MKKLILLFFILFLFEIKVYASSYEVKWENTYVDVNVLDDINNYSDIPKASIYKDGVKVDCTIILFKNVNGTDLSIVNTSKVGEYKVTYKAYCEEIGVSNTMDIIFNVVDNVYPVLNVSSSIDIEYGQAFDFYNVDYYDNSSTPTLDVDISNVNFNKLGTYKAIYYLTDGYNTTIKEVQVNIIDTSPPIITNKNNIINVYDDYDFMYGIESTDSYDKNVNNLITYESEVNLNELGEYDVTYFAYDNSNNLSTKTIKYQVVDRTSPIIELKNYNIELPINYSIDYTSYINSISDNYYDMLIDDVIITSNVCNKVGRYKAIYQLTDQSNNVGEAILNICIKDNVKPIIETSNQTIDLYSYFDPYNYVYAMDNLDGDISDKVTIISNNVDPTKNGEYEVVYYVYDSSGNETIEKIKVYVGNNSYVFPSDDISIDNTLDLINTDTKEEKKNYIIYVVGVIVLVIILVIIIFKRRRKK